MNIKKYIIKNNIDLSGKRVVLTGATGGLGKQLLIALISANAHIVCAVRNIAKAEGLIKKLSEKYDPSKVEILHLDLSVKSGVDGFVEQFARRYDSLDILINNAGMYNLPVRQPGSPVIGAKAGTFDAIEYQKYTHASKNHSICVSDGALSQSDNPEVKYAQEKIVPHLAINFINTLYLTEKMLKFLRGGKVINMSSLSADFYKLNIDNLQFKSKMKAYGYSKMLFLMALFKVKEQNPGVGFKICNVHPGVTATGIISRTNGGGFFYSKIGKAFMKVVFQNASKSGLAAINALAADIPEGSWAGPRFFKIWGKPKTVKLSRQILNQDNQAFAYSYYKNCLAEQDNSPADRAQRFPAEQDEPLTENNFLV